MEKEKRIPWIDIAKALVMLLVVFGHTMRGGTLQRMVYSFHVPAFFFLSGMTVKTEGIRNRIRMDGKRILVPYVCFGIISILIYAILGRLAASKFSMSINTSIPYNLLGLAYAASYRGFLQSNAPLWFLPCLFAVKLMYYAMDKLTKGNREAALALSLPLAAVGFVYSAQQLPMLPFSFSVALKMAPFFALGAVFMKWLKSGKKKEYGKGAVFCTGAVCIAAALLLGYLFPKVNYSSDTFPNIPVFCVAALCGCAGISFLSMSIGQNRLLEQVGKNTLAILVMHKFPVLFFQILGPFETILEQNDTIAGNICGLLVSGVSVFLCLMAGAVIKKLFPFLLGLPGNRRRFQ